MGSRGYEAVLRGFDALFGGGAVGARTDGELIEAFLGRGDSAEAAFAGLVERHGPMVLRVCRGELRDSHAAEDAFQATFLILARKAGTIREAASIASWLYGVARRVARRARAGESRRADVERRGAIMRAERTPRADGPRELVPEIQEEIDRLPEKYRSAIVLCDLEGLSREEAAGQLRVPAATVRIRLARGRHRLRGRLARRGLAPGLVAAAAGEARAMPSPLADATIRAAMRVAAGKAAGASGPVAALVEEVIRAMFLTKLRSAALLLLTTAAAATCLAAIPLLGAPPDDRPAAAPDVVGRGVVVAEVTGSDVARTNDYVGSVKPIESIDLYARSPGILETQRVDIGAAVKRGQVLATLDAPELISEVEQATARLTKATAQVAQAEAAVMVAEASAKAAAAKHDAAEAQSFQSRAEIEQAKANVLVSQADLKLAKAAVAQAKRLAAQASIISPIDGVVSLCNVHVGDFVRAGDQPDAVPLLTIIRVDRVRVVVYLPERDAMTIKGGTAAALHLDAQGGRAFEGKVSRVAYAVDPATHNVPAEVWFDNPDGQIRPGQSGVVAIDVEPRRRRLAIPAAALLKVQPDGRTAECVRVHNGRAALTRISFAPIDDERVEVVEGLKEGDRVVVDAPARVKDGEAVEAEAEGRR